MREQDRHVCQVAIKDFPGDDHEAKTAAAAAFMAQLAQEFVENKVQRDGLYARRDEMATNQGLPMKSRRPAAKGAARTLTKRPAANDQVNKDADDKKDRESKKHPQSQNAHEAADAMVKKDTFVFLYIFNFVSSIKKYILEHF